MRALRIAALALLPLVAACWLERPNLESTGGGYAAPAAAGPSEVVNPAGTHPSADQSVPSEAAAEGGH